MIKYISKVSLIVFLSLMALQLRAADTNNLFMVKGAGLADCKRYLEARSAKQKEYMSYGGWIDGYLSALNQLSKETYDMAPWQSTDYLASIVENYCRANQNKSFFEAFAAVVQALHKDRLITQSDFLTIENKGQKFLIRKEVIVRVQNQLSINGVFSGEENGVYDEKLADAIKTFQKANSIPISGLPDQATLIKLFYGGK